MVAFGLRESRTGISAACGRGDTPLCKCLRKLWRQGVVRSSRASKRLRLAGVDLRLSLIAHNLFNQPYWEFQEPNPGSGLNGNRHERRLYAELVIQPR